MPEPAEEVEMEGVDEEEVAERVEEPEHLEVVKVVQVIEVVQVVVVPVVEEVQVVRVPQVQGTAQSNRPEGASGRRASDLYAVHRPQVPLQVMTSRREHDAVDRTDDAAPGKPAAWDVAEAPGMPPVDVAAVDVGARRSHADRPEATAAPVALGGHGRRKQRRQRQAQYTSYRGEGSRLGHGPHP